MSIQDVLQSPAIILIRVLGGILLAYVVLPAVVLPRPPSARTALDAAVARTVRWVGVVLVLGHLLVLVRLFHVLPILLLCGYGMLRRRRAEGKRSALSRGEDGVGTPAGQLWLLFTDVMHVIERAGPRVVIGWIRGAARRVVEPLRALRSIRTVALLAIVAPIVGILSVSLGLRVGLAFRYETLSPPEAYVFLTWAKSIAANHLFVDGLYPQGLPMFVAFIGKTTPGMDLYEIIRYTGPLIGMLLVFGIFYACLRLTANVGAALAAAGTFGLFGASYLWHAPWIRQTGPLPQELGFAIALLALPSAVLAVSEADRDHLRTLALAAVGIGLIHPVPLAFFVVLATAGAAGAALTARSGSRHAAGVLAATLAGGAASFAYLPIGILAGIPVFRGLDNPFGRTPPGGSVSEQLVGALGTSAIGHNELSYVAALGVLLAIPAAVWLHRRRGTRLVGTQLGGLASLGLLAVAFYDVRWVGLPINFLGPLGNLSGISLALALGAGFAAVTAAAFTARDLLKRTGALIAVAAVALAGFGANFEGGQRDRAPSEYDSMAAVTRDIMKSQDAFSFTIVGTPQQRQAVAGIGTFIELWVFARDVTVRDARDPGFVVPDLSSLMFARDLGETLPIPTADIYIFVEKEPFPVPEQAPVGPTEEYYYDREKRGRIMATVYGWAEYYRHYHTDMDIHYEDDQIVVYRIRRRPNTLAAAASPQFKDYTWEPGVLFTGGPAAPSEVVIPWRT